MKPEPYADRHRHSHHVRADRRRYRPTTLREYLRWATREYALETPPLDHSTSDVDPMGDPEMRQAAKGWLGMTQEGAQDWRLVACRRDPDGSYLTPMRCAIETMASSSNSRARRDALVLSGIVSHVMYWKDWTRTLGIDDDDAEDRITGALRRLWDRYAEYPVARPRDRSEAQLDAEAIVA